MAFLLAFLVLFGTAITALLLAVDWFYGRSGVQRRMEPANAPHWGPMDDLVQDAPVDRRALPREVRARVRVVLLVSFVVGCGLLVLAV